MTDPTTPTDAPTGLPTGSARPLLQQRRGHEFTRILAFGAARGENVVPNDDLVGPIDSSDEWIRQRTGIITRKRAGKDVEAVDLAEAAAREAIEKAGIEPSQIGVVLVSTVTHTVATPSMASLLAERIGATPAAAYDISAACAGYAYGIAQADSFIKSGARRPRAGRRGREAQRRRRPDRPLDLVPARGRCRRRRGRPERLPGHRPHHLGFRRLEVGRHRHDRDLQRVGGRGPRPTMRQAGQTVFRWAVWEMVKVARQALETAGVRPEDLAAFVPHQANIRIIDEFAKQLGLPETVTIARDITTTGNTSAASIPLATHRLLEEHPDLSGGLALQIGFGAGLVFGAQVVVLP